MEKKMFLGSLFISVFTIAIMLFTGLKVYGESTDVVEIVLPNETIKLYKPITIENEFHYQDGGSVGYTVKDSNGTEFSFCYLSGFLREKPDRMFIGIASPSDSGGIEIPLGGAQEKVISKMLEDCRPDKDIADFSKSIELNPDNSMKAYYYYLRAYTYCYNKKDYNKAWDDVHKAEELGYNVDARFLSALKKASGREK